METDRTKPDLENRTDEKIDTQLARSRSWIVRDNDDNAWGPFDSAVDAATWAKAKWPNIPQYDEATFDGHGCWDIEALRDPQS